jgi:hypothetical protein
LAPIAARTLDFSGMFVCTPFLRLLHFKEQPDPDAAATT